RITNNMLNKNSKIVTKVVTPVYERMFQVAMMKYVQELKKMYPYHKLFPSSK
ncbi:hypothetical protein ILUMI_16099, partial [Ignelater luminosus]